MDKRLYDLCDWAEIETIVYSEHDNPHSILGPHVTDEGILINVYIPTASGVMVKYTKSGKEFPMELADDSGFYAVLIPGKKVEPYILKVVYDNGVTNEIHDPYSFEPVITPFEQKKFEEGICYDIYNKMGAHIMEINGVKGVLFAVWAPNALRISVVGNFNLWDGRRHQMRRLGDSGIFELFIPELGEGEIYKYELKLKDGLIMLKSDPYSNYAELRPNNASIVVDLNKYHWTDSDWMKKRKKIDVKKEPMSIYEMHLGSWRKPPESEEREFYNYREIAPMLADYVKELGYTHIELMPIMEHPLDASWGYQVTGYYAATSRYGKPEDFMYFMDYMHNFGIGVILDWVPAHFPRDTFGLSSFDGTCLYEHKDPRKGSHPHWGTLIYNYERPQVSNFLIANALFWVDKYHADGIRMDAVASMLYLDYGKNDGEWIPNIYGGHENLEAVEFLKHLNTAMKKRKDGAIVIAEESTAWPKVTTAVEEEGLGFDLKWNMGWMNDFTNYMKLDPLFRKGHHGELTFSIVYAYSENFILVLSHDEVVHGKCSMINKMPGDMAQKFANLRVAYGFMMAHPGKKLLFMGQDFAQYSEWDENKELEWGLVDKEENAKMHTYMKALNRFYQEYPAMYKLDFYKDGFEWISTLDAERSMVVFTRKTEKIEETLLVVCHFTPVVREDCTIGVPFKGKYKEIFNSDREEFGGGGNINPRVKQSKEIEQDGRENSIVITVPPLGISIFSCSPIVESKKKKRITAKDIQEEEQEKPKKEKKKKTVEEAQIEEKKSSKTGRKKTEKREEEQNKEEKNIEWEKDAANTWITLKEKEENPEKEENRLAETDKQETARKKITRKGKTEEQKEALKENNSEETENSLKEKEEQGIKQNQEQISEELKNTEQEEAKSIKTSEKRKKVSKKTEKTEDLELSVQKLQDTSKAEPEVEEAVAKSRKESNKESKSVSPSIEETQIEQTEKKEGSAKKTRARNTTTKTNSRKK